MRLEGFARGEGDTSEKLSLLVDPSVDGNSSIELIDN